MIIPTCLECGAFMQRVPSDLVTTPHYICPNCSIVFVAEGGAIVKCGNPFAHVPLAQAFGLPSLQTGGPIVPGPNHRGML